MNHARLAAAASTKEVKLPNNTVNVSSETSARSRHDCKHASGIFPNYPRFDPATPNPDRILSYRGTS